MFTVLVIQQLAVYKTFLWVLIRCIVVVLKYLKSGIKLLLKAG